MTGKEFAERNSGKVVKHKAVAGANGHLIKRFLVVGYIPEALAPTMPGTTDKGDVVVTHLDDPENAYPFAGNSHFKDAVVLHGKERSGSISSVASLVLYEKTQSRAQAIKFLRSILQATWVCPECSTEGTIGDAHGHFDIWVLDEAKGDLLTWECRNHRANYLKGKNVMGDANRPMTLVRPAGPLDDGDPTDRAIPAFPHECGCGEPGIALFSTFECSRRCANPRVAGR